MTNRRRITCFVSAAVIATAPLTLHAEMVGTPAMLHAEYGGAQVGQLLPREFHSAAARDDIRAQLESLGVSPALAAQRVAAMTDSQLRELSLRMQEMPAGSGALGIVVTVLVILVLLEILGITDVSNSV